MQKIILFLSAIIFIIVGPLYSFQSDKRSEKASYQKEIEKLKKEDPQKYKEMEKDAVIITQVVLAGLGYWIGPFDGILDEKTKSALRVYQKKRGIPETGNPISFDTIERIQTDMKIIEDHPISLPGLNVFTDLWDKGYVLASGTWVLSNEKMGEPEQTSKILCDRSINRCTEAIAIVGGEGGDKRLFVDIEIYEIERWDEHEIITKPRQTVCTRYLRRFNRLQKMVTGLRSTISNDDMCKGVDKGEKHMVLSDGFKVHRELIQEHSRKWRQLLNISPALLQYLGSNEKSKLK